MIKTFDGLLLVSLLGATVQKIKESCQPTIPAENWANQELYYKDLMDGVSAKQRMKNLKNGKYYLPNKAHPEPHRDPNSGKIIIENCKLYHEDVRNYGTVQAQKWVKEGRYNLTTEELEKEYERIRKEYGFEYS